MPLHPWREGIAPDHLASLGILGSFRRKMAAVLGSTPKSGIQNITPHPAGNLRRNSNCARDTAEKRHGRDMLGGSHPRHALPPLACPRVHKISRTGRNSTPATDAASRTQNVTFPPRAPASFSPLRLSLNTGKSNASVPLTPAHSPPPRGSA